MTVDDLSELTDIIGKYRSPKQWCVFLKISKNTCNSLAHKHPDEKPLNVAEAYLHEVLNPCWEDIVHTMCKDFRVKNPAKELADKHGVDFYSITECS